MNFFSKKKISRLLTELVAFAILFFFTPLTYLNAATIGDSCTNTTECNTGDCVGARECFCQEMARRCEQTKAAGQFCFEVEECFSGICKSDPGLRGDICGCTSDDDCEYEDQQCVDQLCTFVRNKWAGQTCADSAECHSGECRGGICTCVVSGDCRLGGQVCTDGRCLDTTGTAGCTSDDQCTTGICVTEINRCGCRSSSDCQEGSTCENNTCYVSGTESSVEWTSPIGPVSPTQLIGKAIKAVLGILGAVALLIFVYGGFVWMTSGGSPEKIKTARTTLVWAVLGMAVIFLSYGAIDFVLKAFGV